MSASNQKFKGSPGYINVRLFARRLSFGFLRHDPVIQGGVQLPEDQVLLAPLGTALYSYPIEI